MTTRTRPTSLRFWLNLLAGSHVMHYILPYMMILLVAGTIAQKSVGLFAATKMFFTSFVIWVGFVPLPGGATALGVLLLNLTAYFILNVRWTRTTTGSGLTHLGVIVLLLGGLVSMTGKQEGFIILRHGQQADAFYDYHDRVFGIAKNGTPVFEAPFDRLREGRTVKNDALPFDTRIVTVLGNSAMSADGKLEKIDMKKEDETNQAGLVVVAGRRAVSLAEFTHAVQSLRDDDATYTFSLKRVSFPMPFTLDLKALNQDFYPGTQTASSYETQFTVNEHDRNWPAHVSMNNPLRYKGYSFYQASVLTLPNGEQASVLNAVRDTGWMFPYAATVFVCIGLLLNAWVRRHAKK